MTGTKWTIIASVISLTIGVTSICPAEAAKPTTDYFSAGGNPNKAASAGLPTTNGTLTRPSSTEAIAVKWFEKFDDTVYAYKATSEDKVILTRGLKQELERVQQWTATANKVAKQYRTLASTLKTMPVPGVIHGAKEYRDLTAEWYDDAAEVYEDLTRPRRPAKTMEELDALLAQIDERSLNLQQTFRNLKDMDMSLRKNYRVHAPRYDDALSQYVRSKPH